MKKKIANIMVLAILAAATCGAALAQAKEEAPDRAVVPLSNPAKPAKVEVSVMRGSITIKAYEGKDIIVEARVREKALLTGLAGIALPAMPDIPVAVPAPAPSAQTRRLAGQYERARDLFGELYGGDKQRREDKEKKIAGMKQLGGSSSGLSIEEADNVVEISTQSWKAATDLVIQVPVTTSLEVRSTMDGVVVVEGVSGEIDINNINGPVTLTNVSGNTLVHAVNGDITVVMNRVAADKPMSFSTMTGDIDVTLPADIKANLKMKTDQGEIYTDFDMTVGRKATRAEESEKTEAGKYRITFDKSLLGLVNGGGPEISFNTFSGDIYIRKKK